MDDLPTLAARRASSAGSKAQSDPVQEQLNQLTESYNFGPLPAIIRPIRVDSRLGAEPMDKKASEAACNFKAVFDFRKMDTMIHRFPPGLGEIISSRYPYMVVPRFVAIGPYHHGKKHLENMEAVKKAAAHFLWQRSKKLEQAVEKAAAHYLCQRRGSEKFALDDAAAEDVAATVDEGRGKSFADETPALDDAAAEVVAAVDEARGKYFAEEAIMEEAGIMKMDGYQFAVMMICDASFLLLYMDAYYRSYGGEDDDDDGQVDESMRRFLFCNRDRINKDIMLLENQLPWGLIQVLMRLGGSDLKDAVSHFIAAMGSSFKIRESSELEPYVWDDENNPPPHLLALLRRHKTEEPDKINSACAIAEPRGSSTSVNVLSHDDVENNNNHPPPPSSSLDQSLIIHQVPTPPPPTQPKNRDEVVISAISPMDLKQIGIKLTTNPTAKFSDMSLEKGWVLSRLKLAPLSLDDTGASWLVNMAAFEVCTASRFGDPHDRTAVCSYLSLLALFMVGSEDVRDLRSMGILRGPNKDDEMLAFFETLKKHLPDYGAHFAEVMADIEEYQQNRPIRTRLYRLVYNKWKIVGAWLSIIFAVVTAIATLIRLYQALLSLIHNN